MKRFRLPTIIAVLALGLSTLVWVGLAHAQSFHANGDTSIAQGQTVDGTLYSVGHSIDIAGTVNGDVLCAGQSLTITGTIHGDVLCAAQTIDISGTVDGSVRAAGQSISISGTVNRNVSVAAQSFVTHSSAKILGDLSAAGSSMNVGGSIGRDLATTGNDMTIAAQVGRNVKVRSTYLTFTSDARVLGNADYISINDATVNSGAVVKHLTHTIPAKSSHHARLGGLLGFGAATFIYILLAALLMAAVLILLVPKFFHDVTEEAVNHLGFSMLTGFLSAIAVTVALIALAITLIGIPLAFLVLWAWLLIVMLSFPVTAYYLGSMVLSKAKNPVPVMLLGMLILIVATAIPVIGVLIAFIAFWIGSGSLLRYLKHHWPKPEYKL